MHLQYSQYAWSRKCKYHLIQSIMIMHQSNRLININCTYSYITMVHSPHYGIILHNYLSQLTLDNIALRCLFSSPKKKYRYRPALRLITIQWNRMLLYCIFLYGQRKFQFSPYWIGTKFSHRNLKITKPSQRTTRTL